MDLNSIEAEAFTRVTVIGQVAGVALATTGHAELAHVMLSSGTRTACGKKVASRLADGTRIECPKCLSR